MNARGEGPVTAPTKPEENSEAVLLCKEPRAGAVALVRKLLQLTLLASCAPASLEEANAAQVGSVIEWGGRVMPLVLTGTRFTAIAAGVNHSLALKSDGVVVAWGSNEYGQCEPPSGFSNVVAIAAGLYHSL